MTTTTTNHCQMPCCVQQVATGPLIMVDLALSSIVSTYLSIYSHPPRCHAASVYDNVATCAGTSLAYSLPSFAACAACLSISRFRCQRLHHWQWNPANPAWARHPVGWTRHRKPSQRRHRRCHGRRERLLLRAQEASAVDIS